MQALEIIRQAEKKLAPKYTELDEISYVNQQRVIESFKKYKVRETHFSPSSGYGYGDLGRDVLEEIYADIFAAEDALVRGQIVSGTHAISACLFGILRPGDELISIIGSPYDTLGNVIGKDNSIKGTLTDRGIRYREIPLLPDGQPDSNSIAEALENKPRMVLIQRSRGYTLRESLRIEKVEQLIKMVKSSSPDTIVMVDNCYGEFTDTKEPSHIGADIMAGSLIKNPGGGLAPSGGYIVGKSALVEEVSYYLTAPGLGKELGASLVNNRYYYQGLFLAPHVVIQALKGALLLAYIFEQYNYEVFPGWQDKRADIVQAIKLNNPAEVLKFCQIIQENSPVDSDVKLEYADIPGYTDKVVMAAGTFVQGSSIELSCDAPLRYPYCVYLQGGLTYEHVRYVTANLINALILRGEGGV